jgi:hypothetical protein
MAQANLFTTMTLLFLVLTALMVLGFSLLESPGSTHVLEAPQDNTSSWTLPLETAPVDSVYLLSA